MAALSLSTGTLFSDAGVTGPTQLTTVLPRTMSTSFIGYRTQVKYCCAFCRTVDISFVSEISQQYGKTF